MLNQYELCDQFRLQLSPLDTDTIRRHSHNLSLEQRATAALSSLGHDLHGHVQQRPAR
jgi:hypothetical protein